MKTRSVLLMVMTVLATAVPGSAIENLRLSLQGSNVVLSWPSLTNQAFYIQYVPNLNPGTPWTTLAANYPAAQGTNWTSFVHSNIVERPPLCTNTPPPIGDPTPPGFNSAEAPTNPEDLLPHPLNPRFAPRTNIVMNLNLAESNMESETPCPIYTNNMGFYRVFIPAPRAIADVFSVAQNSGSNQLQILANDSDPESYGFVLSNVTAASHGTIQYTDNAKIFRYTPTTNYWGMDTFSYTLTNEVGGFAGTSVWVFVNKTGNQKPSAAALTFTLFTNQSQISFPALTNATDSNGDPLSVALLFQPVHGTSTTNTNGVITYTRTSTVVARDTFSYVITDGRGGFVRRSVVVVPQDSDGDGMPDEWERQHGLDAFIANSNGDGDGDGLPNLAEYKLHANPQMSDSPLTLTNISIGQRFSGVARVPLNLDSQIDRQPLGLLLSTNEIATSLEQAADGSWHLLWNTIYLTNGPNSIALTFQFNPDAGPPASSNVVSASRSIVLTNEVIANLLNSEFTTNWWCDLTFAYKNADWQIDIWDQDGGGLYYLGYFSGTTTNGKVLLSWDLKDQGQQAAFGDIRADVYVSPSGQFAAGNTKKAQLWFLKQGGTVGDDFAVAWGWDRDDSSFVNQRTDLMLGGVINILGDPSTDSYFLVPPPNSPYAAAFRYDTDDQRETLIAALENNATGNFFWFGHGSATSMQGNSKKSQLDVDTVENHLFNKKHRSTRHNYPNKHPYRLVILNGCKMYSAAWANAFGFDYSANGTPNDVVAYRRQGRQPQAFVAWTKDIEVPRFASVSAHQNYALALAYLTSMWMEGFSIESCLLQYQFQQAANGNGGHENWRVSGSSGFYRGAR
jgi:hypothetical protein